MHIPLLQIAGDRHATGEERDVPDEREHHGQRTVLGENADGPERIDHAEAERHDVRYGRNRNGDGGVRHHDAHAHRNGQLRRCATPGGQHHEGVVDADTCDAMRE